MHRGNRFNSYAEIVAKFDSVAKCGHLVKKGDRIGYSRARGVQCADCWRRWAAENAEADLAERRGY